MMRIAGWTIALLASGFVMLGAESATTSTTAGVHTPEVTRFEQVIQEQEELLKRHNKAVDRRLRELEMARRQALEEAKHDRARSLEQERRRVIQEGKQQRREYKQKIRETQRQLRAAQRGEG